MIFKSFVIANVFLFLVSSCSLNATSANSSIVGMRYVNECKNFIESRTSETISQNIDTAYVEIFKKGSVVAFTEGSVGTFGERDKGYKQHWACGFLRNELVYVTAPMQEPIWDLKLEEIFENYELDVKELLFNKEKGEFKYCCEQLFSPDNIKKHNPDF
ncbi:hypothetical protein [Rheinheimera salexigens]|uniref:Uncharacterized protein n=1 Tax=Rheinheimera salexigens TaxID=1628148 RepID=A0A1E7Q953_9GAMM|nr:hypothetical protein [Rheinheimera salexigens]OEY70583.1 hypothetical protein BI198_14170 [Rheinheimera salexigens]